MKRKIKIFTKIGFILIFISAYFLNFSWKSLMNDFRNQNVVDVLWQSQNKSSVVDLFNSNSLDAAEVAIDSTVSTTILAHQKSGKHTVCTSGTVCYAFYIDVNNDISYQKSTNGGATWSGTETVLDAGTWVSMAVWYDKWTPGDSGAYVHIIYYSTADDLMYERFNTVDDTHLSTEATIASAGAQGSLTSANDVAVSKGTDGDLYAATVDATAPTSPATFAHKCLTGSDCTASANWASAGSNPWDGVGDDTVGNHSLIMLPLPDDATHDTGDMMLVSLDITDGTVEYKVYDDSGNSWSTDFTNLPQGATDSTTYTHTLSGAVDPDTGSLYLAFVHNAGTANTGEVRACKYSGGSWSSLTDPWPDSTDGTSVITDASIGVDSNNDDLYVVYSRGSSATANDVYYAISINDGSSWSSDNLLSSGTDRNHRAISVNNFSADRLFAVYHDLTATTGNDLYGNTVAIANSLPSLSISQPDGASDTVAEGSSYNITYTLADSDNTVTVAFYYDTNNSGLDGTTIAGACASAAEGSGVTCSWDTSGVSSGSYYVYGITTDGINSQVSAYSSGQITINDPPTITVSQPDGTDDTVSVGSNYNITYTLADSDNTVTVAFYYDTNNSGLDGITIAGACASAAEGSGVTCSWDTSGVSSGSYYVYGITTDGINSQVNDYSSGQITIVSGTLSVLIVDGSGTEVSGPEVSFSNEFFDWSAQQSTGTLGFTTPTVQKIRVNNTTGTPGWTLSISATSGVAALWSDGSHTYDFNDTSTTGRLQVNSASSTITPQGGCSSAGLNKQSAAYFDSGNSVDIIITSGTEEASCYWDITGIGLTQDIPAVQDVGSYSINMTLTIT